MYRSGDNLQDGAISFINEHEEITLFSAYLKLSALERLNNQGNIVQIIVRWEIEDLCKGVSDIGLYDYCIENKIALYRNTRIHLKAFWNNKTSVLFGSANVTGRGIGEIGNYNFELNGKIDNISFDDQRYLNKIIHDSEYVSEELFHQIKERVDNFEHIDTEFPILPTPSPSEDHFLINQLPMTSTPELLYSIYRGEELNEIEMNCASHDLEFYKIAVGLSKDEFLGLLQLNFNKHPFIVKFKEAVKNSMDSTGRRERDGSMHFGPVKRWFSSNTTTVPTPRPYELTSYIVILYDWICYFDNDFYWDRPKYSQVIYYKK
ncbi:MAG: hypothetical protein QNK85_02985 [Crocinitomicaceae bacterium]